MAKLTAYGAEVVTKLNARNTTHHKFTYVYALTTDGRILIRDGSPTPSSYRKIGKIMEESKRTEQTLRNIIRQMGREVY